MKKETRYIVIPMPRDNILNKWGGYVFLCIRLTRYFKRFTFRRYQLLKMDNQSNGTYHKLTRAQYRDAMEYIAWQTATSDVRYP